MYMYVAISFALYSFIDQKICLLTPNFYYAKHWSSLLKMGISFFFMWILCPCLLQSFAYIMIQWLNFANCFNRNNFNVYCKQVMNSKWLNMIKYLFSHNMLVSSRIQKKIKVFFHLFSNNIYEAFRSTFFLNRNRTNFDDTCDIRYVKTSWGLFFESPVLQGEIAKLWRSICTYIFLNLAVTPCTCLNKSITAWKKVRKLLCLVIPIGSSGSNMILPKTYKEDFKTYTSFIWFFCVIFGEV